MKTGNESSATPQENGSTGTKTFEEWCAGIDEKLFNLLLLFQEKIQDDIVKGQLFEKLYHDMTNYREDFVFKNITNRVFMDIIRLFDRVDGMLKDEAVTQIQRDDLVDHVRSFREEILHILQRQEVSLIESRPGKFNEVLQEAIHTRLVSHPEEDQKVMEIVRRGFKHRDRILRPEEVVVAKYKEGDKDE